VPSIKCPVCKVSHPVQDPSARLKCPRCGYWINFRGDRMITVHCAHCSTSFAVKEALVGKPAKCRCGKVFRIQPPRRAGWFDELIGDTLPQEKHGEKEDEPAVRPPPPVPRLIEREQPQQTDLVMTASGAITKLLIWGFILGMGFVILQVLYRIFFCEYAPPTH
jgi:hypothetical protein